MAFPGTGKIWMNGELVEWKDANIHIASHVIHYGSAVFEGARCYKTATGPAIFRLEPHLRRLLESAKIYRMQYTLDLPGWVDAVLQTIRINEMKAKRDEAIILAVLYGLPLLLHLFVVFPSTHVSRYFLYANAAFLFVFARGMARGASALIQDLKQRGLLEDTIILWTTEFGRMPSTQGGKGRDHNPYCFTNWLCGGGIRVCYEARLPFDGHSYATNPTMPPAEPLRNNPKLFRTKVARKAAHTAPQKAAHSASSARVRMCALPRL